MKNKQDNTFNFSFFLISFVNSDEILVLPNISGQLNMHIFFGLYI